MPNNVKPWIRQHFRRALPQTSLSAWANLSIYQHFPKHFLHTWSCLSMALIFLNVSAMILHSSSYSSRCSSLYCRFTSDCSESMRPRCFMTQDTITSSITSGRITSLEGGTEATGVKDLMHTRWRVRPVQLHISKNEE